MGHESWARLLAIASAAGTALISAWLIEYGISEAGSDRAYFITAPLFPVLFAAVGTAGILMHSRTGQLLAWAGAALLTICFALPGMIGPLYVPAALLMLIAAALKRRSVTATGATSH